MERTQRKRRRVTTDRGSALLIVLGALLLLSAMGLGLVLETMAETLSSGHSRRAHGVLYAAEAGLERVLPDLLGAADWDTVLDGRLRSGFVDGPSSGRRQLADGRSIDLDEVVNLANCGRTSACGAAEMDAVTEARPWGPNNPRWRLFAHGPLAALLPDGDLPPGEYLVVLVGDDPGESDQDPQRDGLAPANAGAGVLLVRAEAFGPDRAHRVIEATVARGAAVAAAAGYRAQQGQGGTSEGGAAEAVQVPGGSITRTELTTVTGGTAR